MEFNFFEKTPDERASLDIKSAMDSVNLVNELVTTGTHSEQIDSRVQANYQHLEIVLKRENVISYLANNSSDTEVTAKHTAIQESIVSGTAFAPIVVTA